MVPLESTSWPVKIVTVLVLMYVTAYILARTIGQLLVSIHPDLIYVLPVVIVIGGLYLHDWYRTNVKLKDE